MNQRSNFKVLLMLILLIICLILNSCYPKPTPYQPKGFSGGFKEKKMSEDTWEVTFAGNIYIKPEKEKFYTLVRCAEIAVQNGRQYFTVLREHPRSHRYKIFIKLSTSSGPRKKDVKAILESALDQGVKLEPVTIGLMGRFGRRRASPADRRRDLEASRSRAPYINGSTEPLRLDVAKVSLAPSKITAGSTFDLIVEFTAKDLNMKQEKIPVQFGFSILKGTKVVYKKEPFPLESFNGKPTKRIQNVTASKKRGNYTIEIKLKYKDKIETRQKDLKIE